MDDNKLTETTVNRHTVFEGKIITVYHDEARLPNGKVVYRESVSHPGGVCIAAIDNRNNLLFVRQFRYPFGKIITELPAGKLEPGEDPVSAAERELKEEVGASAKKFEFLGQMYPTPGYCGEVIHLFYADDISFGTQSPDEDEFLDVLPIPFDDAVQMVLRGDLPDAKTQIAILKLWERKQRILQKTENR